MSTGWWPWAALVLLGAYHGVNPGMGWLFAVGRGLQERSRKAVLTSLLPIAIGHEASIVLVVIAVSLTEQFLPPYLIRLLAALVLISFGVYKLLKPRSHPGGFGMRVDVPAAPCVSRLVGKTDDFAHFSPLSFPGTETGSASLIKGVARLTLR